MLDDDGSDPFFRMQAVNEIDGVLARLGVKIGQGFIKEKNGTLVNQDTAQTDPLLLTAREVLRPVF